MLPPTGDLRPGLTADGSVTFFSEDFGEWFHSRAGAYAETHTTYVQATDLATFAQRPTLTLLDVCYGLGYNTAAALATIQQVNPGCRVQLVALELDPRVPQRAMANHLLDGWPMPVQSCLKTLAETRAVHQPLVRATLRIGDARQEIQTLVREGFWADVIFFDPFSPPHCPELWTVEFMQQVAACLRPQGRLATYSCAAAVRTALRLAGLNIGPIAAAGRRWPGTLAQFQPTGLAPLSSQEQEHLATRAAVPYRDPNLSDSREAICLRRQQEQAQSSLGSTSCWRQRWQILNHPTTGFEAIACTKSKS
ncbi:MAG: tRNA (5-methylaminomethyl-2-thiouridine)(34)-methyltransferase MnmD [Nodosilinea sp.]